MAKTNRFKNFLKDFEFWSCLKIFNVMVFNMFIGFYISVHVRLRDNLVYRQFCMEQFHNDFIFCYQLDSHRNFTKGENEVLHLIETASSHVFLTIGLKTLAEFLSAGLLCSWSDSCGRKFPLLISLLGLNVDLALYFLNDVPYVHFLWSFPVVEVICGLFGGFTCIFGMSYCYLVESSSVKYRTMSFTFLEVFSRLGVIIGVVTYKTLLVTETKFVRFISLLFVIWTSILWMWLTLVEKEFVMYRESLVDKIKALFSKNHYKKCFEALLKWRLNCGREQLCLLAFSALACMISFSIVESVIFSTLFKSKFFDDYGEYNEVLLYYTAYSCAAQFFVICALYFTRWYRDSTLGIVGFVQEYLFNFISAFSKDYFTYILGLIVSPLRNFNPIALRSSFSKIAEKEDLGKLFFFFSFCESSATTFFSYFLYQKLRHIFVLNDEVLSHMLVATGVVVALCTYTFQKMSVQTEHLFKACYRGVPITSIETFSRYRDSVECSDAE